VVFATGLARPRVRLIFDGIGRASSENLIRPRLDPVAAAPPVSLYLLGGATVKLRSSLSFDLGSPGESPSSGSIGAGNGGDFFVASSLEALFWRSDLCCDCLCSFVVVPCRLGWWMSGQWLRTDVTCTSRRRPRKLWCAAASWGKLVASMAWVAILCRSCGEVVGSVDAPQRRWLTFRPGRRPRMLVQ
jgi:hypothetical protein